MFIIQKKKKKVQIFEKHVDGDRGRKLPHTTARYKYLPPLLWGCGYSEI